jgi:hypothetical protein
MMLNEPKCYTRGCIHFKGVKNDGDETTERVWCDAFPDGIPDDIAYGDDPHTASRDGEVTFEQAASAKTSE